MAPERWSRLPCEIVAMIAGCCDSTSLQNLTRVNRRTHQLVSWERRRRLQKAKFHLYDSEEERKEDLERMGEEGGVKRHPGWPTGPVDVVTSVVVRGKVDALRLFLDWGLDIRRYNRDGVSILGMAFETKNPGIGKYLITSRRVTAADVSAPVAVAPFATRFLALHRTNSLVNLAVIRGKDWAVDHFINLAGPQIVPAIDNWAAIGAFSSLRPSTMARLLSASLPFELTAWTSGWTPIHFSISNPDYGMFDLAFQRTPKTALHRLDSFGDSLLFHALHKQNYYALEKLLASGVSPNIPNRAGVTPLNCACLRVDAQAVRLLIQYGATARVGSSTTEGTSLNAFAEGMWENRDKDTREDAQEIFDALVGAGARGDQVGPDSSVEELIRIRFSMGSLHDEELSYVSSCLRICRSSGFLI